MHAGLLDLGEPFGSSTKYIQLKIFLYARVDDIKSIFSITVYVCLNKKLLE